MLGPDSEANTISTFFLSLDFATIFNKFDNNMCSFNFHTLKEIWLIF